MVKVDGRYLLEPGRDGLSPPPSIANLFGSFSVSTNLRSVPSKTMSHCRTGATQPSPSPKEPAQALEGLNVAPAPSLCILQDVSGKQIGASTKKKWQQKIWWKSTKIWLSWWRDHYLLTRGIRSEIEKSVEIVESLAIKLSPNWKQTRFEIKIWQYCSLDWIITRCILRRDGWWYKTWLAANRKCKSRLTWCNEPLRDKIGFGIGSAIKG